MSEKLFIYERDDQAIVFPVSQLDSIYLSATEGRVQIVLNNWVYNISSREDGDIQDIYNTVMGILANTGCFDNHKTRNVNPSHLGT